MEINKDKQYNQGVGKFKVLSSNAGVGSIITIKSGFFIMPQTVSFWGFVKAVNKQIENFSERDPKEIAKKAGVDIIDDPRFVKFLKKDQEIPNLLMLIDVPHLSLSEWNYPQFKEHHLYKRNKELTGSELTPDHFSIPAIHFPRWFYSRKEKLFMPYSEWKRLWKEKRCNGGDMTFFAPPRDPYSKTNRTFIDNGQTKDIYEPLVQIPILLICKNGHISDIPWYELFCAGIEGHKQDLSNEKGFELFNYPCQDCEKGGRHQLQWIENRNNSESWGILKCKKCGKTYGLEGIMNIKPFCMAETPWNGVETHSEQPCKDQVNNMSRGIMQMALVTSNSIYYANSFSSLYIPPYYLEESILPQYVQRALDLLNNKWFPKAQNTTPDISKEDYINSIDIVSKADDSDIELTNEEAGIIKAHFLQVEEYQGDTYEKYRFDEYMVFSTNSHSRPNIDKLEFNDIELPTSLKPYFAKIQQVNTLSMTLTQLGFNRVSIPVPKRVYGTVIREKGQLIYNGPVERVYSLPANQSFGEGIFFEFKNDHVKEWAEKHKEQFDKRYNQPEGEIGKDIKDEMNQYGAPVFYLLHTFSHIILKELEFSCGYPTASLQERLYYSDRMCGVLIYTTDGAEGSMGGLVWQGQPRLIEKIISSALLNGTECSSDPLCWENEDQLNLAACFSCCLVSETSCEKRNMGLDRRALIDPYFGFFKELV
ncbi:MAG: DUF1998 domain-containing protein [Bacteroidales bacterium]|jgi:hypothetical protein